MFSYVLHKFHKHFMCAEQLWYLHIFLLGISVVVLHGLFVKLGQNISEKCVILICFLIEYKQKPLKSEKKPEWCVPEIPKKTQKVKCHSFEVQEQRKIPVKSCPKELKQKFNYIAHPSLSTARKKKICKTKALHHVFIQCLDTLNPENEKILTSQFWEIAILRFLPYEQGLEYEVKSLRQVPLNLIRSE